MIGRARLPDKVVTLMKGVPSSSRLEKIFGPIRNGVWSEQERHMGSAMIPMHFRRIFGRAEIYCNRHMAASLTRALRLVREKNLQGGIKSYDGCFDLTSDYPEHRYGLAVAFNADAPYFDEELIACFRVNGFTLDGFRFRWTSD